LGGQIEMSSETLIDTRKLVARVAELIGAQPSEILMDTPLLEAGLDSISVMRMVEYFRSQGFVAKFDVLTESPTIDAWLKSVFPIDQNMKAGDEFAERNADGDIAAGTEAFELTPVQQAYWLGRQDEQPLGGVGCHLYLEFDGQNVDPVRLEWAVLELLQRHPMLRAGFSEEGLQKVEPLRDDPPVIVNDWAKVDDIAEKLKLLRSELSHCRLPVKQGTSFAIQLSRLANGRTRLHVNIDLLVADVLSISVLMRDLALLYQGKGESLPVLALDFKSYLEKIRAECEQQRVAARRYWQDRLPSLPGGPKLPLVLNPDELFSPRFVRREFHLDKAEVDYLQAKARINGLTLASVFATAFAEVLARWSDESRFLINIPLFDRRAVDPSVQNMVADFTSLVLLEVDIAAQSGFGERAKLIQAQLHRDIAHAAYSGVDVLRDMARCDDGIARSAPVVFACNLGAPFIDAEATSIFGHNNWMLSQTPQVWLDHQTYPTANGLLMNWDAVEALFPDGVLDAMFTTYEQLIRSLGGCDWSQSVDLPLPATQQRIRHAVNSTECLFAPRYLHEMFFDHARTQPERSALLGTDCAISYRELAELSLKLAALLKERGVMQGDVVAVALPKGSEQVISVLGILAAGAVYLPIAWGQPAARTRKICERGDVKVVITNSEKQAFDGWPDGVAIVGFNDAEFHAPLLEPYRGDGENSAYIIFTSGSTGEPKGVEITHQAAWNTIHSVNERFAVSSADRVLALSELEFDLSVYDIFGMLCTGGAVVIINDSERRDPVAWLELVQRHRVTVWNSVPALLEMTMLGIQRDRPLASIRLALLSGDWIALDLPRRMRECSGPALRFIAMGGATEAAIWSNAIEVGSPPETWRSIPYGLPLSNQQFRVVGSQGGDCPDLVAGEIWIGGAGVARCYKGAPELTASRFVIHEGKRWYRTGDLGRYWSDGTLEFLGRIDHQVKIRGHRIELGEVECALEQHPAISRAAATIVGQALNRLIVAGIVLCESAAEQEIHDFAADLLPDYMTPRILVPMDALPLTANGKIDRAVVARAAESRTPVAQILYEAPRTDTECSLARFWNEALGVERAGRAENFFQLGGNSLQAARLAATISRSFNISLSLRKFLSRPTIQGIADIIDLASEQQDAVIEEGIL